MKRQPIATACLATGAAICTAFACAIALIQPLVLPAAAQAREHKDRGLIEPAPTPKPINYDKLTQEAVGLLQQYVRFNTTNPPGNELYAAKMLKEKFLGEGIPATVWEPAQGRGIVAARRSGLRTHR